MAETDLALARVQMWGRFVGAVFEDERGVVTFEFDEKFRKLGLDVSPIKLSIGKTLAPVTFAELRRLEAFQGLPGMLADSLPDRFGNAVIRKYFEDRGQSDKALSPVQRLLYMGSRAMGALEFKPALEGARTRAEQQVLEISDLVEQARQLIEGKLQVAMPEIMRVGASAGGARPKAVILWNRATNVVRSGFAKPAEGDEHWLVKFDGVGEIGEPGTRPRSYNRIEYAYSQIARAAGLETAETQLFRERGFAHLMSRRFDRDGAERLHMHSLGGMQHVDFNVPRLYSYEGLFRTILELKLGYPALEESFRRAIFNIVGVNQDDHVKNISFLMDRTGRWRLAPAYDLTFSKGAGFTREHQMSFAGKSSGFTREDLLRVGGDFGLKNDGRAILEQVADAFGRWPEFAAEAGVAKDRITAIAGQLRWRLAQS
jgi:serine/threonine-protein kinase HipA